MKKMGAVLRWMQLRTNIYHFISRHDCKPLLLKKKDIHLVALNLKKWIDSFNFVLNFHWQHKNVPNQIHKVFLPVADEIHAYCETLLTCQCSLSQFNSHVFCEAYFHLFCMWSTVLPCLDKDYKNQVIIIIMLYCSIFMSKCASNFHWKICGKWMTLCSPNSVNLLFDLLLEL